MKGFILGVLFGVVLVILILFANNNLTGNLIKDNFNDNDKQVLIQNNTSLLIQNETKENILNFKTFRVYNPNSKSKDAILLITTDRDEINEVMPIIKMFLIRTT